MCFRIMNAEENEKKIIFNGIKIEEHFKYLQAYGRVIL